MWERKLVFAMGKEIVKSGLTCHVVIRPWHLTFVDLLNFSVRLSDGLMD